VQGIARPERDQQQPAGAKRAADFREERGVLVMWKMA